MPSAHFARFTTNLSLAAPSKQYRAHAASSSPPWQNLSQRRISRGRRHRGTSARAIQSRRRIARATGRCSHPNNQPVEFELQRRADAGDLRPRRRPAQTRRGSADPRGCSLSTLYMSFLQVGFRRGGPPGRVPPAPYTGIRRRVSASAARGICQGYDKCALRMLGSSGPRPCL